ncbi:MAG TPA: HNH endonuclease signature motif containing protein [Terriglobales bacterium]|jgi:hypothetical protein|nr:HNH endonuclease signature motif containing protein [Terriglobales bacterium]
MGRPAIPFDQKYIAVPEVGCWIWTSALDRDGYGVMSYSKKAHRVSYELHVGPIPAGMSVCHRCDVRCCVNPGHLFLGSSADNTRDMVLKGRQVTGRRTAKARLTEDSVRAILASDEPCFVLAERYGVTDTSVSYVRMGRTWKHVPRPDGYVYKPYRAPGNHARWKS